MSRFRARYAMTTAIEAEQARRERRHFMLHAALALLLAFCLGWAFCELHWSIILHGAVL